MEVSMDRLAAMSVFVSVVDSGSLSAAGRRLGMPLATVSRKIADLEATLRTRLLRRSTRKLTLTDAGADYLAACRRILDDVAEAEAVVAGEYLAPRGDLVVTAPVLFGRLHVLPVANEFLAAYPDVDMRLLFGDRNVNLFDDHVDAAIRIGELPDSTLVARRLGSIREVVCGSPAYFAARGTPRHPTDLASHACVTFAGLASPRRWEFRSDGGDVSVGVHSRLVADSADAAIGAALSGVGLTRALSYQIADALRSGALRVVLDNYELAPRPVQIVYASQGRRLPLKLRAFIDFAEPRLRERLVRTALP
jgi:DNA-binding transcriptional LysR family regulator